MLIRTGQVSVKVDSLDRGIRAVRELATRAGGYVANSSIVAGDQQSHTATLELKIPASHFDAAITGLQPIGSRESVNVTAEDVGEEYVDVEEIERQEGRMRHLRPRAALSTLAITVHEKVPVVGGTGSGGMLADAFKQSWRNFIGFVASVIAAMGTPVPLGAIVATIAWAIWRARRSRQLPSSEAGA